MPDEEEDDGVEVIVVDKPTPVAVPDFVGRDATVFDTGEIPTIEQVGDDMGLPDE